MYPDLRFIQIEGMFTVVVGVLFLALFPKSPSNPTSIFGFRYFTEREAQILQQRVLRDDPSKAQAGENVSRAEVKATVSLPLSAPALVHKLMSTG